MVPLPVAVSARTLHCARARHLPVHRSCVRLASLRPSRHAQVGATLRVLNLSQQSDSGDLMGGFRPVDPGTSVAPMLDALPGLLEATWPKGDHGAFQQRLQQYAARGKWVRLLAALQAAAGKAVGTLQPDVAGRKRKWGDAERREELWYGRCY